MRIRLEDDRFVLGPLPEAWREALRRRGLPEPDWDPHEGAYVLDEEGAASVRFLHDAHRAALDAAARARLDDLVPSESGPRLAALEDRLRPYQKAGVEFLADRRRALLADGMGLGKSVQALVALERLGAHPAVVVCPASVKHTWRKEIEKWVPWRSVQVLWTGADVVDDVDLVVLNPELLDRQLENLFLLDPEAVVLDEAHMYKNPQAQRTQMAEELMDAVGVRFALTGTPIPNRRPDLIHQLRLLGRLEDVLHIYRGVLPHWWRPEAGPLRHAHAMRALEKLPRHEIHRRLREVCFLRRTKDEVTDDLPPFHRSLRGIDVAGAEAYRREEESFIDWVRRLQREGTWTGGERLRGRQRLHDLRREAALAKIPAVVEWAEGLEGERVLYFAHHKQVVHALAKALRGRIGIITGDVPQPARQAVLDSFPHLDGLVATMDSTGQGVDGMQLHARHVVFIELDWTPTKHEQCEGRLHRVGQQDRVEAWYFVAEDTIDTMMMKRLEDKWRDVQGILGGEEETMDRFLSTVAERAAAGARGAVLWR